MIKLEDTKTPVYNWDYAKTSREALTSLYDGTSPRVPQPERLSAEDVVVFCYNGRLVDKGGATKVYQTRKGFIFIAPKTQVVVKNRFGKRLEYDAPATATIVVTRHKGLVEHLVNTGVITQDTAVIVHASPEDVRGKHVIGVLPLSLAALAASVTEVPLALTPELRGLELNADQVAAIAGDPITYQIKVK